MDLEQVGDVPDEERVANVTLVVGERERTILLQVQLLGVAALVVHHVRVLVCDDVEVETIHAVVGGDLVFVFVHDSHAVVEHHHASAALDVGHREHVGKRVEAEVTRWR